MARIYDTDGKLIYENKNASAKYTVISAIEEGVALDGADLRGFRLDNINFGGVSLVGADFRRCDIWDCSFVGADLSGARFDGARASRSEFSNMDFLMTSFKSTDLEKASFRNVHIESVDFSRANLWGAVFHKVSVKNANMAGANIFATKFGDTNLSTVDFSGAVVNFSAGYTKEEIQRDVEALNTKHLVARRYGWVIEAKGPGQPSKWNGEWENLFVCAQRTCRMSTGTDGLKNPKPQARYGGFSGGPKDTPSVLADRGQRYGSFEGHAAISQALQKVVYKGFAKREDGKTAQDMTDAQREALFMILHKVARIVNGDFNYDDSWRDIAGYATLVTNLLDKEKTE
jgi:hypothetical protein|nr:MAG TPA: pentapeptide repeat protein [Caudoviricetes sp.]